MFSSHWSLTGSPFNWLRRHQSKAVLAFKRVVLSINPDRRIQNMFGGSGLCFSLCRSFFHSAHRVIQLFLHRRVSLNSVVFFSPVFSLLIFGLWLSWWRLSSFEGVILCCPAQLCPSVCADLLYVIVAVGYESSSQCLPGLPAVDPPPKPTDMLYQ